MAYPAALTEFLIAAEAFLARVFRGPVAADVQLDAQLADVAVDAVFARTTGVVTLEGSGIWRWRSRARRSRGGVAAATAEEGRWVKSAARAFDAVDAVAHAWTRRVRRRRDARESSRRRGRLRRRGRWFESSASSELKRRRDVGRSLRRSASAIESFHRGGKETSSFDDRAWKEGRNGTVYLFVFVSVLVRGAASGLLGRPAEAPLVQSTAAQHAPRGNPRRRSKARLVDARPSSRVTRVDSPCTRDRTS